MKKRNLVIAAFILTATLLMGIGFAALNGTLNITGTAYFYGTAATNSDILTSLKFANPTNLENCTATIATNHSATMDVVFNDTNGVVGEEFTATATFDVVYDSDTIDVLPDIEFSVPNPTIVSASGAQGFSIDTDWDAPQNLSLGDTIQITVTVTYINQDPVETGAVSAQISVPMPYATIAD